MHVSFVGVGPARDQTIVLAPRRVVVSTRVLVIGSRRARARARVGSRAFAARRRGRVRARQRRAWRRSASACRSSATDPAAVADLADQARRRSRRGRPRRSARRGRRRRGAGRAGHLAFGPNAAAAAARRLEDVDEGRARRGAGVPTAPLPRRSARADEADARSRSSTTLPGLVRREDRRARRGQGRGRHRVDRRRARRGARVPLGRRVRRRGPHVCDRGRSAPGPRSRCSCCATARDAVPIAARAGSQARVRRRRGPEHGRHGRVLAGARVGRAGRSRRRDDGEGDPPDARGAAAPRRRVPRLPLLRAHARSGEGPAGARVQRALRRPRVPGAHAAPRERSLRALLASRPTGRIETEVELADAACVGVALASEGYPPAPIAQGRRRSTGSTRPARSTASTVFHAGHRRRRPTASVVTNGGRVLTVTATGPDLAAARDRAYAAAAADLVARRPLPSRHRAQALP